MGSVSDDDPYLPMRNTNTTYYKLLRRWDPRKLHMQFDTADNTSRVGTETFYMQIKTRGQRTYYYRVTSTLMCGNETVYTPEKLQVFTVEQNATTPNTNLTIKGFWSDIPRLCGIKNYRIVGVADENQDRWKRWDKTFKIDNKGMFTILDTTEPMNHMMIYIQAISRGNIKTRPIHALNVSITPSFSVNTNFAPVFQGVAGNSLPIITLYIGENYG